MIRTKLGKVKKWMGLSLPSWFSPFIPLLSRLFSSTHSVPRLSLFQEIEDRVKVHWLKQPLPEEDYFRLVAPARGGTVVVVGSGYGYCALQCLQKVGREGKVIVIEPDPRLVSFHHSLFSGKRNVVLVPKAAMNKKGKMYFSGEDYLSAFSMGVRRVKVSVDTLDHICFKLGVKEVDYMAMDVEGAEIEALKGGRKILRRTKKIVVGAYHLRGGKPHLALGREIPEEAGFQDESNRRWCGPCLEEYDKRKGG